MNCYREMLLLGLVCVTLVTVVRAQREVCAVNLVMTVDASGSIVDPPGSGQNWIEVTNFLRDVVERLTIDEDHALVGLVRFDNKGKPMFPIGSLDKEAMKDFIMDEAKFIYRGGRTNTEEGLKAARDLLDQAQKDFNRVDTREVILVLTDGKPTSPQEAPGFNTDLQNTISGLKARGVRIIGVGITDQINATQLREMVSNPNTDYFTIDRFKELASLLMQIIDSVCEFFTTSPLPTSPSTTTTTTTTTTPVPTRPPCGPGSTDPDDCKIDLVLIVDESGSIYIDTPNNVNHWLQDIRPFLLSLIGALDIGEDSTRVGMVMFQDDARRIFYLNQFFDKERMGDEIMDIYCRCADGGTTNIAGALNLTRAELFQPGVGDRPDVPNVAILMTDGRDNRGEEFLSTAATQLKDVARVLAVGVTNNTDEEELTQVVVSQPGDYIRVENFAELASKLDDLITRTCIQPCDPICPPPTPREFVVAFSAYTTNNPLVVTRRGRVLYERTYSNIGEHYNIASGDFTCPCRGIYFFSHTYNGLDEGFGSVIMKNNVMISPLAYVSSHGATTTNTVIECNQGEQVYVQIVVRATNGSMSTTFTDNPLTGFVGHLIARL